MKPSTIGGLAALLGFLGVLVHGGLVALTALGAGLGSTPEDRVPALANTLWAVAGFGTPLAAAALVWLLLRWTKPLAVAYAGIWVVLVVAYWVGWIVNAGSGWTDRLPFLLLEAALPFASASLALYGVWRYRAAGSTA